MISFMSQMESLGDSSFDNSSFNKNRWLAAVLGARGYSGQELLRLLAVHPNIEQVMAVQNESELRISSFMPGFSRVKLANSAQLADAKGVHRVAFLATPHEGSWEWAPRLKEAGWLVIDFSGAFRLKGASAAATSQLYEKWYGAKHPSPDLVDQAKYGLAPFCGKSKSDLIANPGCYATAVAMAVKPLLDSAVIDSGSIVIDAKSGTTGAGKKLSESLMASEVVGECWPYKIGKHQHVPEIEQTLGSKIIFSTHLLDCRRGILASCYLKPRKTQSDAAISSEIEAAFTQAYRNYPLVRWAKLETPEGQELCHLRSVVGTSYTHITYTVNEGAIYCFSMIDNLMKGAASQAVENFNLLIGLPPETSLMERGGLV